MVKVDDDIVATVASEVFSYITDQRLAQDRNGRFGAVFGKRPQARAVAGGENHCTHERYSILFQHRGDVMTSNRLMQFRVQTLVCALRVMNSQPKRLNSELLDAIDSLGCTRGIANHEIECAGRGFSKARVAVEGNSNTYRRVLAGKLKAAFQQAIVNLIDMECAAFFTQQESNGLRNSSIHEAIAHGFGVWTKRGDLLAPVIDRERCSTLRRPWLHCRLEFRVRG